MTGDVSRPPRSARRPQDAKGWAERDGNIIQGIGFSHDDGLPFGGNPPPTEVVTVLVVEDNSGDARLVAVALAGSMRQKFRVSVVTSLAMARDHLGRGAVTDIILLDLSLPDAVGEETVLGMREAAPHLPIVIMTGMDDVVFAERMVALGAQDYLVKGDFTGPMLWRTISYAITRMHLAIEREALVRELRASVEMKNRMFGILAHDLRTPISAVGGYAELLEMTEEGRLSERMSLSLRAIRESAAYMNTLIEDVLAMAVAEAGAVNLIRHHVDLGAVARKAVSAGGAAATKKNVRLIADTPVVWVEGDAAKLEQVLNNLIGNAVKFSHDGEAIAVSVLEDDHGARLSVSDQGVGMSPDVLANLFKPFAKGKAGTAGERSNGLGLYICSQIVAAHGGTIEVDSTEGAGSKFTVIMPNVPADMMS